MLTATLKPYALHKRYDGNIMASHSAAITMLDLYWNALRLYWVITIHVSLLHTGLSYAGYSLFFTAGEEYLTTRYMYYKKTQ